MANDDKDLTPTNSYNQEDVASYSDDNPLLGKKDNIEREYDGQGEDVAVEDGEESSMATAGALGLSMAVAGSGKSLADDGLDFAKTTSSGIERQRSDRENDESNDAATQALMNEGLANQTDVSGLFATMEGGNNNNTNTGGAQGGRRATQAGSRRSTREATTAEAAPVVDAPTPRVIPVAPVGATIAVPAAQTAAKAAAPAKADEAAAAPAPTAPAANASNTASEVAPAAPVAEPAPAPVIEVIAPEPVQEVVPEPEREPEPAPAPEPSFNPNNARDVFTEYAAGRIGLPEATNFLANLPNSTLDTTLAESLLTYAGDDSAKTDFAVDTLIARLDGGTLSTESIERFLDFINTSALQGQSPSALLNLAESISDSGLDSAYKDAFSVHLTSGVIQFQEVSTLLSYDTPLLTKIISKIDSNADVGKIISFDGRGDISSADTLHVLNTTSHWRGLMDGVLNSKIMPSSLNAILGNNNDDIAKIINFANTIMDSTKVDALFATGDAVDIINQFFELNTAIPSFADASAQLAFVESVRGTFDATNASTLITKVAGGLFNFANVQLLINELPVTLNQTAAEHIISAADNDTELLSYINFALAINNPTISESIITRNDAPDLISDFFQLNVFPNDTNDVLNFVQGTYDNLTNRDDLINLAQTDFSGAGNLLQRITSTVINESDVAKISEVVTEAADPVSALYQITTFAGNLWDAYRFGDVINNPEAVTIIEKSNDLAGSLGQGQFPQIVDTVTDAVAKLPEALQNGFFNMLTGSPNISITQANNFLNVYEASPVGLDNTSANLLVDNFGGSVDSTLFDSFINFVHEPNMNNDILNTYVSNWFEYINADTAYGNPNQDLINLGSRVQKVESMAIMNMFIEGRLDGEAMSALIDLIQDTTYPANGLVVMVERLFDLGLPDGVAQQFLQLVKNPYDFTADSMYGLINATIDGVNSLSGSHNIDGVFSLNALAKVAELLNSSSPPTYAPKISAEQISDLINYAKLGTTQNAFVNLALANGDTVDIATFIGLTAHNNLPAGYVLKAAQLIVDDPSENIDSLLTAIASGQPHKVKLVELVIDNRLKKEHFEAIPSGQEEYFAGKFLTDPSPIDKAIGDVIHAMSQLTTPLSFNSAAFILDANFTSNELIGLTQKLSGLYNYAPIDTVLNTAEAENNFTTNHAEDLLRDLATNKLSLSDFNNIAQLLVVPNNAALVAQILENHKVDSITDYSKALPFIDMALSNASLTQDLLNMGTITSGEPVITINEPPISNDDLVYTHGNFVFVLRSSTKKLEMYENIDNNYILKSFININSQFLHVNDLTVLDNQIYIVGKRTTTTSGFLEKFNFNPTTAVLSTSSHTILQYEGLGVIGFDNKLWIPTSSNGALESNINQSVLNYQSHLSGKDIAMSGNNVFILRDDHVYIIDKAPEGSFINIPVSGYGILKKMTIANGKLYIVTDNGLIKYDIEGGNGSSAQLNNPYFELVSYAKNVWVDNNGYIHVLTDNGIEIFQDNGSLLPVNPESIINLENKDLIADLAADALATTGGDAIVASLFNALQSGSISEASLLKALYLTKIGAPISPINDSSIEISYTGLPAYSQAASYIQTNHPELLSSLMNGEILPDVINKISSIYGAVSSSLILGKLADSIINYSSISKLLDAVNPYTNATIKHNFLSKIAQKGFDSEQVLVIAGHLNNAEANLAQLVENLMVLFERTQSNNDFLENIADISSILNSGYLENLNQISTNLSDTLLFSKIIDAVAHHDLAVAKTIDLSTVSNKSFLNTHIITRIIDGTLDADVVNNYFSKDLVNKLSNDHPSGSDFMLHLSQMAIPKGFTDPSLTNFFTAVKNGDIDVYNAAMLIHHINAGKLLYETFSEMMLSSPPPSNEFIEPLLDALGGNKLDSLTADTLISAMVSDSSINESMLISIFNVLGESTSLDGGTIDANTAMAMVDAVSTANFFNEGHAASMLNLLQQENKMTGEAADNLLKLINNNVEGFDVNALNYILANYDAEIDKALDLLDGGLGTNGFEHTSALLNNWLAPANYNIGKLDLDNAENGVLPDPTEGMIGGLGGLDLEENIPPAA